MINTVTLNPAIDVVLYLDEFVRNRTNRVVKTARTLGGKGTHVSINLSVMGVPSRAFGFAYGDTGREIVDRLGADGVTPRFLLGEGAPSRVNYMVVEERGADATLIADRGPVPSAHDIERFCAMLTAEVGEGELLALSGDASNFPDPYIYNRLIDLLSAKRPKVFLDASGPSLRACLEKRPFLVKPNREELSQWMGEAVTTRKELIRAVMALDARGVEVVAVSLGEEGSLVKAGGALYRARPPEVFVRNTVGCGDCFVAGLLRGYEAEAPVEEILRYATAASAACAESPLSVGFDPSRALEIAPRVQIQMV